MSSWRKILKILDCYGELGKDVRSFVDGAPLSNQHLNDLVRIAVSKKENIDFDELVSVFNSSLKE